MTNDCKQCKGAKVVRWLGAKKGGKAFRPVYSATCPMCRGSGKKTWLVAQMVNGKLAYR